MSWCGTLALLATASVGCNLDLDDDPEPRWFRPGIRTGTDYFRRHLVLDAPAVGAVTSIGPRLCGPDRSGIVVAGTRGAVCADAAGKVTQTITFPADGGAPVDAAVFDADGDGRPEYWRCSRQAARCSFVDADGRERWHVDREGRAWNWAYGDFDGDGGIELAVADRSAGPITLYAGDGSRRWTAGESVSIDSLGAADVDGDHWPDLLVIGDKRVAVLDKSGRVKGRRKLALENTVAAYAVVPCPHADRAATLLASVKDGFIWLDVDGRLIRELEGRTVVSPAAAMISARQGEQLCAVLGSLLARDDATGTTAVRGRLQVYAPDGRLVYDEVFDHDTEAIALVNGGEELWIGEASRVWQYEWRDAAASPGA